MENPWIDINWKKTVPTCDWYYFALLGAKLSSVITDKEFETLTKNIETAISCKQEFDVVKIIIDEHFKPKKLELDELAKRYVERYNIQIETLPEPYSGDPESNVYLLNMNPGGRDEEYEKVESNRLKYELLTKLNLTHQLKHSMWYQMKGHDGYSWIKNKTNQLCKEGFYPPRFFMIEYFPYHSVNGFKFPSYLPSYQYTNNLIRSWINNGHKDKVLIILRKESDWNDRLGNNFYNEIKNFSSKATIKNHQNVSFTRNNIVFEPKGCMDFDKFKELTKQLCFT